MWIDVVEVVQQSNAHQHFRSLLFWQHFRAFEDSLIFVTAIVLTSVAEVYTNITLIYGP